MGDDYEAGWEPVLPLEGDNDSVVPCPHALEDFVIRPHRQGAEVGNCRTQEVHRLMVDNPAEDSFAVDVDDGEGFVSDGAHSFWAADLFRARLYGPEDEAATHLGVKRTDTISDDIVFSFTINVNIYIYINVTKS